MRSQPTAFVAVQTDPGVWTVGLYGPSLDWHPERWEPESTHATADAAAERVNELNGGTK